MNTNTEQTPQSVIEDAIAKYPTLFHSRSEVLHHIFIVLGSGYDWHKGAIACEAYLPFEKDQIPREEAKRIATITGPIKHAYPWCEPPYGCLLAEMPKDAKPEWREAAEEIRELLRSQGYAFTPARSAILIAEERAKL